ncbi:signal-transducing adaptor protein 2b isoform X2 [Colossoma macropomum]|uniref:signal-transducing adaptor protein 2b isoform X2 n=1 Tax=Colossoma macropomum TaxID=42526 RepID=UPI0018643462|nr:signal-transducing adaptor protein 2b isoform X2 [Colossoma macropomum]
MASPRRAGRPKSQLPTCYHEGFLEKRSVKDKTAQKLWTSLCGNSLFFFNSSKDSDYVEKLDLSDFVSLIDDSSQDRSLEAGRLQLHLKGRDFHLTAPSLEARELWKGFIFSVVELAVPTSLNLLPGQIHMLREVVEKEKLRRKPLPSPPASAHATITVPSNNAPAALHNIYVTTLSEMPACYQLVSRAEAELVLERNQEKGNLLLRPGRDGSSFAVSTRQDLDGPVYRHYRVTRRHEGGFDIAVENPIQCETLHDVINCLVEKTGGTLKPLTLEGAYEKNITFVDKNRESGERSLIFASSCPGPCPSPPVPGTPKPEKKVSSPQPENEYVIPSDVNEDKVDGGAGAPPPVQPRAPARTLPHQTTVPEGLTMSPGGALLPPSRPIPRRNSMSEMPNLRARCPQPDTGSMSKDFAEELKQKLKQRQATIE